jgi:MarR family 2-MHQ and catechol resistance regulon transcriptional repressor
MDAKDRLNGKLIIALGRTYRNAHRRSNELFREKGLTMPQFTVLELLYNRGEQTIQQIIDKVLSSSGNITVVVRNLERMELVYRRDNPYDRRSYLIGITQKGKELMDATFVKHMSNLAEALSKLTTAEKEQVVSILKKLR